MPINGIKPRFIGYDNLGPFENQSIDYNRAMESRMLENVFGNCRGVDEYEKLNRIGEGTYGTVYRARDRRTNEIVALKRILLHNEQQNGVSNITFRSNPRVHFISWVIFIVSINSDS